MVIPYFLFVMAMAAASQFPPWAATPAYASPAYAPVVRIVSWNTFGKADHKHHMKAHHKAHKVHKAHHAHK